MIDDYYCNGLVVCTFNLCARVQKRRKDRRLSRIKQQYILSVAGAFQKLSGLVFRFRPTWPHVARNHQIPYYM